MVVGDVVELADDAVVAVKLSLKCCLYYFVTVTVVAAVTEVVVGALIVVVGVVGVVCVVTMVAVDGGVDGDIEVAVVDNDEASLGQSETHIHHMYHAIHSCTNLFYSAQYCVSNFQEASDFTRSLRLCFVAFNLWKNCTCEKRFEKICICHKISLKYEVSFLRGLQQFR